MEAANPAKQGPACTSTRVGNRKSLFHLLLEHHYFVKVKDIALFYRTRAEQGRFEGVKGGVKGHETVERERGE